MYPYTASIPAVWLPFNPVQPIVFPDNYRCIGLHAGLGRGKTTSLIQYVKSLPIAQSAKLIKPDGNIHANHSIENDSKQERERIRLAIEEVKKVEA